MVEAIQKLLAASHLKVNKIYTVIVLRKAFSLLLVVYKDGIWYEYYTSYIVNYRV